MFSCSGRWGYSKIFSSTHRRGREGKEGEGRERGIKKRREVGLAAWVPTSAAPGFAEKVHLSPLSALSQFRSGSAILLPGHWKGRVGREGEGRAPADSSGRSRLVWASQTSSLNTFISVKWKPRVLLYVIFHRDPPLKTITRGNFVILNQWQSGHPEDLCWLV